MNNIITSSSSLRLNSDSYLSWMEGILGIVNKERLFVHKKSQNIEVISLGTNWFYHIRIKSPLLLTLAYKIQSCVDFCWLCAPADISSTPISPTDVHYYNRKHQVRLWHDLSVSGCLSPKKALIRCSLQATYIQRTCLPIIVNPLSSVEPGWNRAQPNASPIRGYRGDPPPRRCGAATGMPHTVVGPSHSYPGPYRV